jgi:hypothetical protein
MVNIRLAYDKNDYRLEALICYYGRHYTAFCFSKRHNEWLYMSDTLVETVGPLWEQVVDRCKSNRFQPYLLFYCSEKPSYFNAQRAPQVTKFIARADSYY